MKLDREKRLDEILLSTAEHFASMSYANRLKVGAVIYKNDNIISMGWNGTPAGADNNCEIENADGSLTTKTSVMHAESNAILKASKLGGQGLDGATIYTTYSPCPECAKLIKQAGIKRVVYRHNYRLLDGIDMLKSLGVPVEQLIKKD